ncbi:MAG: YXWGXW repeat-containing protein [Terriglobales bacterium]
MHKLRLALMGALLVALPLALAPAASAQIAVGISVRIGPPPLRVLAVQPYSPGPGYLWTPGYWAYGPEGYYWVRGMWVLAPAPGLLWTPGYWGYGDGVYRWHGGYWGPHVGFYGGINYGFGYFGTGFVGGHWSRRHFYYNTAVWRVNTRVIHNTYVDRTVIRNERGHNHVSFNGGPHGIRAHASGPEMRYEQERHRAPTPMQSRQWSQPRARRSRPSNYRARVQTRQRRGNVGGHARDNAKSDRRKKDDKRGPGGGYRGTSLP